MADYRVRSLERAYVAGDLAALPALAAAYLRGGRTRDALRALGRVERPDRELAGLERSGWRAYLRTLRPARRFSGVQREVAHLGWPGPHEAALGVGGPLGFRLLTLDLARGASAAAPLAGAAHAVPSGGVVLYGHGRASRLDPGGRAVEIDLPQGSRGAVRDLGPGRGLLVATELAALPGFAPREALCWVGEDGAVLAEVVSAVRGSGRVDWRRGRMVWTTRDGIAWATADGARGELAVRRPAGLAPARLEDPLVLLADGRVLVPWALGIADLRRPGMTSFGRPGRAPAGPFRLSLDGEAVVGFEGAGPARLPVGGSGGAHPGGAGPVAALWHPRADVATWQPGAGPCELLLARDGRPRRTLRLPADARPLAWTPAGDGLLVLRRLGPSGGTLELWEGTS